MLRRPVPRGRQVGWPVLVTAVACVGLLLVEPLRRSDLMVFLRAAGDVVAGRNPYTSVDDPFLWQGSAYVYPYLTAYLFVPLTWVSVPVADVLWFVASASAVVVGCRALGLRDLYGITAVLVSGASVRSLQVGAINGLLLLGLALMWRYRERMWALASTFGFVAGAKLFLLPMALWVAFTQRRTVVIAAGSALSAYLGLGLLLEPVSPAQFYSSMGAVAEHEGRTSMSLLRWTSVLLPHGVARTAPLVLGLVVVAGALALGRRRPGTRSRLLFAACVVASLLATPIYWSHYTLLVVVPLLLGSPTRRAALWFCACTWVVSRPVMTWQGWQGSMNTRMLLLYGVMALALVPVCVRREPDPAQHGGAEPRWDHQAALT